MRNLDNFEEKDTRPLIDCLTIQPLQIPVTVTDNQTYSTHPLENSGL